MAAWRTSPNWAARQLICPPIRADARQVVLALRARKVTLVRPKRNHPAEAAKLPKNVTLTLVEAREVDPPDAVTPVHWRLLTTHPVVTLADACRIPAFTASAGPSSRCSG